MNSSLNAPPLAEMSNFGPAVSCQWQICIFKYWAKRFPKEVHWGARALGFLSLEHQRLGDFHPRDCADMIFIVSLLSALRGSSGSCSLLTDVIEG